MATKSFLLGSAVALAGIVSCGGQVKPDEGASSTSGNATPPTKNPPNVSEPSAPSCKVAAAFTPQAINPPTAPVNVCTTETLDAIVEACLTDLPGRTSDACLKAREVAANKTCADCIFGSKSDATWKPINIDQGKSAHFNQAGCIEHVTGVVGCGEAYVTIVDCVTTFCPDATTGGRCDERTSPACLDEVRTSECRPFLLGANVTANDEACASALQSKQAQVEETCFIAAPTRAAEKTFFVNIAAASCMKQ